MPDTSSFQEWQRKIESSRTKYNEYDTSTWINAYFDEATGGYLVVDVERERHSHVSKSERLKHNKEREMALVFARHGYRVEMLKEVPRISFPDVRIDGVPAELKRTASAANILNYAKKATRKQGAQIVLFQFDEMTAIVTERLKKLSQMGIHGKYFIKGEDIIIDF